MSGRMLERAAMKKYGVGKKNTDMVAKMLADEYDNWLGKFGRGELQSNLMLPYVTLYYHIQDQVRVIKDCTDYVKELEK